MVAPSTFKMSYRDVFVESAGRVLLLAGDDEAEKTDTEATWVLRWKGAWDAQPLSIRATSIAMIRQPQLNGLFMGLDGKVARWGGGPIEYEAVDKSDDGPQELGDLREIRSIGTKAFVVGMGRTVYRCDAARRWVRVDHGIRDEGLEDSDSGLNSIDGFSEDELVAVGWDGEIWEMSHGQWVQADSPTNFGLHKVLCLPERQVVACGQRGALLINHGVGWRQIEHDATQDDFWSMAWFKGSLYLSTLNAIYRWNQAGLSKLAIASADPETEIALHPKDSFFRLHTDGHILWSVGRKMAIHTMDGARWIEVPYQ